VKRDVGERDEESGQKITLACMNNRGNARLSTQKKITRSELNLYFNLKGVNSTGAKDPLIGVQAASFAEMDMADWLMFCCCGTE